MLSSKSDSTHTTEHRKSRTDKAKKGKPSKSATKAAVQAALAPPSPVQQILHAGAGNPGSNISRVVTVNDDVRPAMVQAVSKVPIDKSKVPGQIITNDTFARNGPSSLSSSIRAASTLSTIWALLAPVTARLSKSKNTQKSHIVFPARIVVNDRCVRGSVSPKADHEAWSWGSHINEFI
jgi:hypothetical protein